MRALAGDAAGANAAAAVYGIPGVTRSGSGLAKLWGMLLTMNFGSFAVAGLMYLKSSVVKVRMAANSAGDSPSLAASSRRFFFST